MLRAHSGQETSLPIVVQGVTSQKGLLVPQDEQFAIGPYSLELAGSPAADAAGLTGSAAKRCYPVEARGWPA